MKIKKTPIFKGMTVLVLFSTFFMWSAPPSYSNELPSGYEAVSGNSSYEVNADATVGTLTATDQVTIGNWNQGFNIGSGNTFNALLPNGGLHLSRDITVNPSQIFGALNVPQGKFFLVNTNGVYFAPGSQVNAAGLVASSLNIQDQDFLSGNYHFLQGMNPASVINAGNMHIGEGGVALLGGSVQNLGLIEAQESSVVLASGKEMALNFDNDGLISVLVNQGVDAPVLDGGSPVADAVSNKGIIHADGGKVYLTAEATDGIFNHLVNQEGVIEANSTVSRNGVIELVSNNSNGIVQNSGTINAKGESGLAGGTVHVLGEKVGLFGGEINVSGDTGGGTVLVGGDYKGEGPLRGALYTFVTPDAVINADALVNGDGGKVILWSENGTNFYGNIFSRGGSESGNGGFVEVSGLDYLNFNGYVDTSAAFGNFGTLLLDPKFIEITNTGASNYSDNGGSQNNLFTNNPTGTTKIKATGGGSISNQNANVLLQANTDVTFTDAVTNTNAVSLTVQAGRDILVNNNVTMNGNITMTANDSAAQSANRDAGAGDIVMAGGTSLNAGTGAVSLNIGSSATSPFSPGGMTLNNINGGSINLSSQGLLTLNGNLNTANVTGNTASTGSITLSSAQSGIVVNGTVKTGDASTTDNNNNAQTATSGNITASAATSVTGTGTLQTGNASMSEGAGPNHAGADALTSGSINVTAGNGGVSGGIGLSNANALVIGSASKTGTVEDTATAGSINLTSRDEINNGTASTPVNVTVGAASGAATNNVGALTLTTTGTNGNAFVTSASPLRVAAITTAGASSQTVNVATTGGANLTVLNAAETLTGDNVTLNSSTGTLDIQDTNFNVGAGSLTLNGNEINLTGGANSIKGTGALVLQPNTTSQGIQVGAAADSGAGNLDLTATDLAAIQNGFAGITIGRSNGTGGLTIANPVTFFDPTLLRSPLGGSINVNGQITGSDNASITIDGSGATTNLNANIVTNGNAITISDNVNLLSNVLLDTTNSGGASGAAIQIDGTTNGTVAGAQNLTLTAGSGNILLNNAVGTSVRVGSFAISNANNVSAQNISANSITQTTGTGTTTLNGALATTGGAVNLNTGSIVLNGGTINSNAGAGNISLTANTGSIDSTTSNGVADLTGGTVNLNASTGGIGATNAVEVTSNVLNANTVTAGSNIAIKGIGDLNIGLVNAGTGNVNLNSTGNINDDLADGLNDITANSLTLTANNVGKGVGTANGALDTTVSNLTATVGSGGIDLANSGNLTVSNVTSSGNVNLSGTSNLLIGSISAGSSAVNLTAASGNINDDVNDAVADITGGALTLNANGVGTSNGTLDTAISDLTASVSAGGLNLANTGNLNILNVTSSGNVALTNSSDISVGLINAGANSVNLTSTNGNINDGANDSINDITAGNLTLTANGAGKGVGTSNGSLDTTVSNLTATVDSGIDLANTGNLTVSNVTSGGNVNLSSTADMLIGSITANTATVNLQATGNINDDTNDSAADVTTGALVLSASGVGTANGTFDTAVNTISSTISTGGLNLENTGALSLANIVSSGNVGVINSADITIGSINAGSNNVNLTSTSGNINDNFNDAVNDITSGALTLTANGLGKGVGTSNGSLDTTASSLTATVGSGGLNLANTGNLTVSNVTSGGNVDLSAASDLLIGSINAGSSAVNLSASGDINDDVNDAVTDIAASSLTLTADGVGTSNGTLDTAISSLTATVGAGGLNIENSGALTLASIISGTDFNFTNASDILVGSINAGSNNVSLTSTNGNIIDDINNDSVNDITASNLSLIANASGKGVGTTNGSLDTAVSNLTANVGSGGIDLANTGDLTISNVTSAGNVNLSAASDLLIGSINAGSSSVSLTASGDINDDVDDAVNDITAGALTLLANNSGKGVGVTNGSLDTTVSNLAANVGSGGLLLSNTGTLNVSNIASTGNVDLTNSSNLTVGVLSASGIGSSATLKTTSGDIFVDAATAQNILHLDSAGKIEEQGNDAAADISAGLQIDLDAVSGIGTLGTVETSTIAGTLSADTTNGDINLANLALSDLTVSSLSTGTGDIAFSQTSSQALDVQSATTTSGNIDLSNDDANLTLGTVTTGSGNIQATTTTSGDIQTGVLSALAVGLTSAGSILDNNAGANNIAATSLNAQAKNGITLDTNVDSITAQSNTSGDITLKENNGVTLTNVTTADGNIDVQSGGAMIASLVNAGGTLKNASLKTTSGDINVDSVTATGTAHLDSAGAIEEQGSDPSADIIAKNIDLDAISGIGTLGAIETQTLASTISADTANGNINIANNALADTTATSLSTGTGNITLAQTGSKKLDVTAATTGSGNITLSNDDADLTLGAITAGGAGDIQATTTTSGDINVDNVTAAGDTVSLVSDGKIEESGNDVNSDITALDLALTAANGVGTLGTIETTISNLTATVGLGGLNLANSGDLTISNVASSGNVSIGGSNLLIGLLSAPTNNVTLNASGKIDSIAHDGTADVVASTINLNADNGIGTISPVDVTATTALNASTTGDNILIHSIGNLPIGLVTTGNTSAGDVTLTSTGAINSVSFDGVADILAKNVNLTANSGGIGLSSPVEITAGGTINANTALDGGNIYLASLGNAKVGLITTGGTGDVGLASTGSIDSAVNDNTADIIGNGVFLESLSGGIGTISTLDVGVSGALFADTTASNSNIVIDGIGNLPVGEVNAGSGNVTLTSTGAIDSYWYDGSADVIGGTINLTAGNGIGISSPLEVTATTALNASTTNDNIFMGSIGNLPLGVIDAGTANITLTSTGNMYDTNLNLNNLKGTVLNLAAQTGIGNITDYIEVLATTVNATTVTGGVYITNGLATSTPPGWSQGKKVGWGGASLPPGLAKK